MKLANAVLAAAAAMTLCAGARAAPPPLSVAPDKDAALGASDPQKLALADRYMVDTHSERMVRALTEQTLRRSLDAEMRRMNAGVPVIPESMQAEIRQAALETARALEPRLRERIARLMASEYTTQELQALVDFYETPVGRQIAEKSLDVPAAAQRITEDLGPQFMSEFKRRFCAREPQCAQGGGQGQ
ncbi:MAG TPA: DUF2059 domain-containing protein [Caulobacteraceae bacterium]|jgi:hypothetical protein